MLKEIIKNSPGFIERSARYIYGSIPDYIKYGRIYRKQYKFLEKSQWWTKEQHEKYQLEQVKRLVKHAYENVPYYKRVFDERGIRPEDIKTLGDLKRLPYLTKEIVRNNLGELTARNYNLKKLQLVTTSGTTRMPMDFYIVPKLDKAVEWAFTSSLWKRIGFNPKKVNRYVIFRGIIPKNGTFEYKGRDLIISSFKMTEENMDLYIKLIEEFKPDFIQAYPSSIHLLSMFILRNSIRLNIHGLKGILCSSETLDDSQREDIEKAFGVRLYNLYGHTEHSCIAGECEQNSCFHVQSEYGYTEIINKYGEEVSQEGEEGEIVATGFNNYSVPFIRYRTEDLVINTNEVCSCGRSYKLVKKIIGRKQEYLVDRDRRPIPSIWAGIPLRKIRDKISAFQYIQNEPGRLLIKIQCFEKITDKDMKAIREIFDFYYSGFELEFAIVEHIERTKTGKYKFLIQNLVIDNL